MGLGGFFKRLSGADTDKGANASLFVFGADKRFSRRMMEATGSHLQDNHNRLAYFSSPSSIGMLRRKSNDMMRVLGPVSIGYEPITELYSFPLLDWAIDRNKKEKDTNHDVYEQDEILDNSWAEGFALATQRQEKQEWMSKLSTILLLAVLGAIIMFLLVAMQTGLLSNFLSAIPKFFKG